jgi:hypothetical protein
MLSLYCVNLRILLQGIITLNFELQTVTIDRVPEFNRIAHHHVCCLHRAAYVRTLADADSIAIRIFLVINASSKLSRQCPTVSTAVVTLVIYPSYHLRTSFLIALHTIDCHHATSLCSNSDSTSTSLLPLRYRRAPHSAKMTLCQFSFLSVTSNQLELDNMTPFNATFLRQRLDAVTLESFSSTACFPLLRVVVSTSLHVNLDIHENLGRR